MTYKAEIPYGAYWSTPFARWQGSFANLHSVEFAAHVAEHGNDAVAELFRDLARFGTEHAYHLAQRSAGMALPQLAAGEYSWLDQEAPVPEATTQGRPRFF